MNILKWLKALLPKKVLSAEYSNEVMTVYWDDGTKSEYYGSSTVWRHYPMMKRCGTNTESFLCDIYNYIKLHGNPYPDAHK